MRKSVSAMKNKTKKLYLIGGPMGVGKTTAGQLLKIRLDNCVFLDGDWCWDMEPFQVTTETKKMVIENICFLLNNFIRCRLLGAGEIVATDNGDPTSHIIFSETGRPAFNGLFLAIVKASRDGKGNLTLKAEADGLPEAVLEIKTSR